LFAASPVRLSILTAFVTMAAFYGVVFLQSLYFQQQRGASALVTGLLFLPMSGLVALFNPFMARAMERFGKVLTAVAGQLIMALGLLGLSLLPADAPTFAEALLMVPVGVGGSFTSPPLAALVMDHVPAGLAGTASGVLNTARQLGGTIGVAAIGAVLGSRFDFTSGLRAVAAMGILLLALAAVSLRLRKTEWVI
jgi:DHA2 family methylenomycin A resistance protein-like MFS transporter